VLPIYPDGAGGAGGGASDHPSRTGNPVDSGAMSLGIGMGQPNPVYGSAGGATGDLYGIGPNGLGIIMFGCAGLSQD